MRRVELEYNHVTVCFSLRLKQPLKKSVVVILALLALSTCAFAETMKGFVVDPQGKPIPKARVLTAWIADETQHYETTTTDENGRFDFSWHAGAFMLHASAESYACETCILRYRSDETRPGSPLCIILGPEKLIRGVVVDENGKYLPRATVAIDRYFGYSKGHVHDVDYRSPLQHGFPQDITDADSPTHAVQTASDGSFTLTHVPDPKAFDSFRIVLSVWGDGRAYVKKAFDLKTHSGELRLVDPQGCILQGTLYLSGKTPASAGKVLEAVNSSRNPSCFARTDKDGRYKFTDLLPGKIDLVMPSFNAAGGIPEWVLPPVADIKISSSASKTLDLDSVKGSLIKCKVVDDSSGKPIEHAQVRIAFNGDLPQRLGVKYISTDAHGECSARVPSGMITIGFNGVRDPGMPTHNREKCDPSVSISTVDGQDRTDIVLRANMSGKTTPEGDTGENGAQKPIPPDFRLIPGNYPLVWDENIDCTQAICRQVTDKYPKDLRQLFKKLPTFKSANPRLEAERIDGSDNSGLLLMAFDESRGTGKGYDIVYVDTNRDGDLSNEKALSLSGNSDHNISPWIRIPSHQGKPGGLRTQHYLLVQVGCDHSDGRLTNFGRKGCWTGFVSSSSGQVQFAVANSDGTAVYSGRALFDLPAFHNVSIGDTVYINGNSNTDSDIFSISEDLSPLMDCTQIGESFYRLHVSDVGDRLTVSRYTGPSGSLLLRLQSIQGLKTSIENQEPAFLGTATGFTVKEGQRISVPVGHYQLTSFAVDLDSKLSSGLELWCKGTDAGIDVTEGCVTAVDLGGKITVEIGQGEAELVLKAGETKEIPCAIRMGSDVVILSILNTDARFVPRVVLLASGGKPVASAGMDTYSPDGAQVCRISVPELRPGIYTLKFSLDTKSELGVISAEKRVRIVAGKSKYR